MRSVLQSGTYQRSCTLVASPTQAAIGTFVGGPVGYIYFIRRNYLAMGDLAAARKSLVLGAVLMLSLTFVIAASLLIPKPYSVACDMILRISPLALVIFARQHAQNQVKSLPAQYDYYSNWRLLGTSLLCMCASFACLAPVVFVVLAIALR